MVFNLLLFLLIVQIGFSADVELFCYWQGAAKGQELFPLPEGVATRDLPLTSQVRKALLQRGLETTSWEVDTYRPWLLSWNEIENWQDLKHWLGFSLTRKEAMLPSTKYWVFWGFGPVLRHFDFSKAPQEKLILYLWEPPTVEIETYNPELHALFGKVFTWNDDLVDGEKFIKFHYPVLQPRREDVPPFEEKKFCVIVCRALASSHVKQLYKERKKFIEFFETKPAGELDLYGYYWEKKKYKNYCGPLIGSKIDKIKEYKFSICYENMRDIRGYVTEKIFDCFAAGVVPIYWGASNITDYVPKECFIDRRDFADEEEVYQFLKRMKKEEYQRYLDAALAFLSSPRAQLFSSEHFVETFIQTLLQK